MFVSFAFTFLIEQRLYMIITMSIMDEIDVKQCNELLYSWKYDQVVNEEMIMDRIMSSM